MHRGRQPYLFAFIVLFAAAQMGCSSSPSVDRDEIYSGPATVAVAPVSEARAIPDPQVSLWWIQKLMAEDLNESGAFAGVIQLESSGAEHEADVVIMPSITELRWRDPAERGGDLSLRIRSVDKRSGQSGIDRVYSGDCGRCKIPAGKPSVAGPLADLMPRLIKDLRNQYDD